MVSLAKIKLSKLNVLFQLGIILIYLMLSTQEKFLFVLETKKYRSVKKNHNYHYQIQTQLHVTKRKECHFFMYSRNRHHNICTTNDDNFWYQKIRSQIH
ncbi:Restriction endonuclease type II-like,Exonuclease, phage-type/RecB, C-terminal, partial [Cinara cedri]